MSRKPSAVRNRFRVESIQACFDRPSRGAISYLGQIGKHFRIRGRFDRRSSPPIDYQEGKPVPTIKLQNVRRNCVITYSQLVLVWPTFSGTRSVFHRQPNRYVEISFSPYFPCDLKSSQCY